MITSSGTFSTWNGSLTSATRAFTGSTSLPSDVAYTASPFTSAPSSTSSLLGLTFAFSF
eukprot:CAMPEP_0119155828 /NCGR_PEP_ID=MMETSP1310-20130426/51945_1 /TAXON_ID=464262 /ORGANISM="Genus nov. species nov., Strain RCC2339" /LENGTH=58 /DNA_ID=CAMNT_0007148433 /DNA_START=2296 /DNA_END=2472 /DNA_ORIENTATION=-